MSPAKNPAKNPAQNPATDAAARAVDLVISDLRLSNREDGIAAIERVRPAAVDAHTGLEGTTGRKDRLKVRRFVEESRKAFARIAADVRQGSAR